MNLATLAFTGLVALQGAGDDAPRPATPEELAQWVDAIVAGRDVPAHVAKLHAAVEAATDPGAFARDLGNQLARAQRWPQAQSFLELARERMPADGQIAQALGNAHVMQHHYREAFEHLSAAEQLLPPGPRPYLQMYQSMVLVGLQRMDDALAHAEQAIAEAQRWNAAALARAGTRGAPPVLPLADFELNLANVHQKWRRWDDALAVLARVTAAPRDAKDQARALRMQAQVLEARGDEPNALAAFVRARELAPRDATVVFEWAMLHVRRSRPAEARPLLEEALRLDPEHEAAWYNLGRALTRLGEKEAAKEALARYERLRERRYAVEVELATMRQRIARRAAK